VAILGKEPAQAASTEPWKSMEGMDPPRGFAFAWFKIGNKNIGVYSLHLKSNLIMHGNEEVEKREEYPKTRGRYISIAEPPAGYNCHSYSRIPPIYRASQKTSLSNGHRRHRVAPTAM